MGICRICGVRAITISNSVGVCAECLRRYPDKALEIARESHHRYRLSLGLPAEPPRHENGVKCRLCVNECSIPPNGIGFCGVWRNRDGVLEPVQGHDRAVVYWYLDPLPTNCVATPVCPAATGRGYPKYAVSKTVEEGYYNLAVFFAGCSLDCLFCQNWEHKEMISFKNIRLKYVRSVEELVEAAMNPRVTCVCYFGGDPAPHAVYAIKASRIIVEKAREKKVIKRICWETNGLENPSIMNVMAELSLVSGGIVKIDWKAYTPSIYQALTGVDGYKAVEVIKKNVKLVAEMGRKRPEIPLLVVSTLLVPGYVDVEEVRNIARYLASINPEIPYILLAFHPDHLMRDLPPTSSHHAEEAYKVAKEEGLTNIFIGNAWLLGPYY